MCFFLVVFYINMFLPTPREDKHSMNCELLKFCNPFKAKWFPSCLLKAKERWIPNSLACRRQPAFTTTKEGFLNALRWVGFDRFTKKKHYKTIKPFKPRKKKISKTHEKNTKTSTTNTNKMQECTNSTTYTNNQPHLQRSKKKSKKNTPPVAAPGERLKPGFPEEIVVGLGRPTAVLAERPVSSLTAAFSLFFNFFFGV